MYARSNNVAGSPQALDEGIGYVRNQVMPMLEQMDGCVGVSMLADRESGRCIVTTAWESEDAMHASDAGVRDSRARGGEIFGADMVPTEWEVALVHRMRPADATACTRVIWGSAEAGRLDEIRDAMRMTVLPKLEELPGFCSMSLMVDRTSGRTAAAVTYESRAAMEQAAEQAAAIRTDFTGSMGLEVTEMATFDLVIAHLRVPEMA